jgi:pentatricopeptide repeat protein
MNERGFVGDRYVGNKLLSFYVKCGTLREARSVFNQMPQCERDVCSWTIIIAAYSRHGLAEEALNLFCQMQATGIEPNHFTFSAVLSACAKLGALQQGMDIHEEIKNRRGSRLQSYVFVGNALVDMYAKCGQIEKARDVFDNLCKRDIVSWNAMISGYAQNGYPGEAHILFIKMPQRDAMSWNTIIAGYAQNGHLDEALKLFEKMPKPNVVSWNAMIAGYVQNGYIDEAVKVFQKIPNPDVVSWNTMIAGYAQNGRSMEALELYQRMKAVGVKPDSNSFSSVLSACTKLAALEQGMEIHEHIVTSGLQSDVCVANALVDMYAKCGDIEKARDLFDKMQERNAISWTAMIGGYAMNGCGKEALKLFEEMQQRSGVIPNHVTFVCVLSACCHTGLVEEGQKYFNHMTRSYNIMPTMQHYCCMVDLFGRAGLLDRAQDFINNMPIKPDATVWACLLGACRIHNNIELGEYAAGHIFELNPEIATPYVLLSNMYATSGRWDEIENVRKSMKDRGVKKLPGCSWIEVNKQVHTFLTGDRSHPETSKIYSKLESLSRQMKAAGYVPDTRFVLIDVEEDLKEENLCHHSEKLAIAFGLLNTAPGTAIRVIKNLRVCGDCHSATKFISMIAAREIVVRDANRYHHFKDGQCSCGDYW